MNEFCQKGNNRREQLIKFFEDFYFTTKQTNFRRLFSLILAEDCESPLREAFKSAIHCDDSKLISMLKDPEILTGKDPLGRTLAHLILESRVHISKPLWFSLPRDYLSKCEDPNVLDDLFLLTPAEFCIYCSFHRTTLKKIPAVNLHKKTGEKLKEYMGKPMDFYRVTGKPDGKMFFKRLLARNKIRIGDDTSFEEMMNLITGTPLNRPIIRSLNTWFLAWSAWTRFQKWFQPKKITELNVELHSHLA